MGVGYRTAEERTVRLGLGIEGRSTGTSKKCLKENGGGDPSPELGKRGKDVPGFGTCQLEGITPFEKVKL